MRYLRVFVIGFYTNQYQKSLLDVFALTDDLKVIQWTWFSSRSVTEAFERGLFISVFIPGWGGSVPARSPEALERGLSISVCVPERGGTVPGRSQEPSREGFLF
jgi:hypothetical protein